VQADVGRAREEPKRPAGHKEHVVAPAREYLPVLQGTIVMLEEPEAQV
jgi:hypothetical protein